MALIILDFGIIPLYCRRQMNPKYNMYDMRLVQHEDGWIYGFFVQNEEILMHRDGDQSAAIAQCGIARTKDLVEWERLARS